MKNLISYCIAMIFATSCQQAEPRLARSSNEIDTVKNLINDFQEGNWENWTTHYTSDAMIYHNSWQIGTSVEETKKSIIEIFEGATSYTFNEPIEA